MLWEFKTILRSPRSSQRDHHFLRIRVGHELKRVDQIEHENEVSVGYQHDLGSTQAYSENISTS